MNTSIYFMSATHSGVRLVPGLCLAVLLSVFSVQELYAQSTAPDDLGPISISLEEIDYPHPVNYLEFKIMGEDVRMAYMDVEPTGTPNGQSVVLMHGLNFFGEYWAGTIKELAEAGFRVVVPDRIGFGRSSKPIIPYSFQKKAANTHRLLDYLEIEEAAIVGHSMGGMAATRFAFTYPESTTHLVLVNMIGKRDFRVGGSWRSTDEIYESQLEYSYEDIRRVMEGYYVEWVPDSERYIEIHYGWTQSAEWPRLARVRALNRQIVFSQPVVYEFPYVEPRTLILSGREDGPDFADLAQQTAEAIPNAQLTLLDEVGHNPHLEAPERFHPKLIEFLSH